PREASSSVRWQERVAKDVVALPDGGFVAAAVGEPGLARFDASLQRVGDLPVDDAGYRRLAWLADGTILGVTYGHGVVVIRGDAVSRLLTHTIAHDVSASGDRVLVAAEDGVWA